MWVLVLKELFVYVNLHLMLKCYIGTGKCNQCLKYNTIDLVIGLVCDAFTDNCIFLWCAGVCGV